MNAEILSVGNEVVGGAIADTNAAWLSQQLDAMGLTVVRHAAVRDELPEIVAALAAACRGADVVVVTGGIGPTPDDLTREAVAELTGRPLRTDPDAEEMLRGFYRRLGREPHPSNLKQAAIPEGGEALINRCGTAAGLTCTHNGARLFVTPGVPREMVAMFEADIRPRLDALVDGLAAACRELTLFGVPESDVGAALHDLMQRGANPEVGTMARTGFITVRIVARGQTPQAAAALADDTAASVSRTFGDSVVSDRGEDLPAAVARLLIDSGTTIALAESCTGGMVAAMLTDAPGISRCLLEGIVAYTNDAKSRRLGVPADLIEAHGAVSAPVAEAMARGICESAGADIGIGITGIAGPGGAVPQAPGRPGKPVGLVHLACAHKDGIVLEEGHFAGDRRMVRTRAALAALNMVRLHLIGR